MTRKITLRSLLIVFGLSIGYLFGEIYFSVFKHQYTFDELQMPYTFKCYKASNFYWNGLKPNSECIFSSTANAFSDFTVKTNSLGLRNSEVIVPKPDDVYRILFIGDSFTFGLGVENEETFPRIIEKSLQNNLNGKKIEVINAGLPGTGPGYNYLYLKNNIEFLKPDLVVIGYFMQNDVPDQIHSLWENIDSAGLPTKIDNKSVFIDQISGQMLPKNLPFKYKVPILRSSHFFVYLADILYPKETVEYALINISTDPVITPETCLYKKVCRDLDESKINVKNFFKAINDLTAKSNAKLLVTFIPAEYQINNRDVRQRYNIYVPLLPNDKEYPYLEFSSFFESEKINYLDIREPLRKIDPITPLYFENDNHWNVNGHRFAAKLIEDQILNIINTQ